MLDIIFIGAVVAFFALGAVLVRACERIWGRPRHAFRPHPRRPHRGRPFGLPRICADPPRKIL